MTNKINYLLSCSDINYLPINTSRSAPKSRVFGSSDLIISILSWLTPEEISLAARINTVFRDHKIASLTDQMNTSKTFMWNREASYMKALKLDTFPSACGLRDQTADCVTTVDFTNADMNDLPLHLFLKPFCNVTSLNLSGCQFLTDETLAGLFMYPKLKSLNLSHWPHISLDPEAAGVCSTTITELDLSHSTINVVFFHYLLKIYPNLTSLNLSDCAVLSSAPNALDPLCRRLGKKVTQLDLSGWSELVDDDLLFFAMNSKDVLKKITLKRCPLVGAVSIKAIKSYSPKAIIEHNLKGLR